MEQCLKTILITCEDVFRTHLWAFHRSFTQMLHRAFPKQRGGRKPPDFRQHQFGVFGSGRFFESATSLALLRRAFRHRTFQKGRFTQSSTSGPSQLPSHSQSGVSFSFAASTRWAESQRTVLHGMHVVARVSPDLADRKADASLYSRVCEPDPLNLGLVAFYVRSFVEQTTVLAEGRAHRRGSRRESAGV